MLSTARPPGDTATLHKKKKSTTIFNVIEK